MPPGLTTVPPSLPAEILTHIFEMNLPPPNMFRPRRYPTGPVNEPWVHAMATKSTVVRVCRAWYWCGVRLLYRDVVVTDKRGLLALRDAISDDERLGALIQSITIAQPLGYIDIAGILAFCPRVKRIALLQAPLKSYPTYSAYLTVVPQSLTTLDIAPFTATPMWVANLLEASCLRLEDLSLPAEDCPGFDDEPLSLPNLHTLSIVCLGRTETFATKWEMPRLTSLTFIGKGIAADARGLGRYFAEYTRILTHHGSTLTHLAFPVAYDPITSADIDHSPLLALCPILERLVLPAAHLVTSVHPTIRWVDAWSHPMMRAAIPGVDKVHYPQLERVRRLDIMLSEVFADLPRDFPPGAALSAVAYPGTELIEIETDGVLFYSEHPEDPNQSTDDEQDADEVNAQANSSSDGSDSDSDDESDSDHLGLRSGVRRMLRAAMPTRLAARFGRAVLGLLAPAPDMADSQ
ncbi:hypothetical protein DFH07DRAFT_959914 [Mycena maculata]|uniref:F-box domain-containing protein n=1 Tax=Mycena maculata TaxID=230809 RepID=A0AAD7J029_9AGAR|nr:hypothetical protein DFH07DRAFT_959914 [Mycena maculata]